MGAQEFLGVSQDFKANDVLQLDVEFVDLDHVEPHALRAKRGRAEVTNYLSK